MTTFEYGRKESQEKVVIPTISGEVIIMQVADEPLRKGDIVVGYLHKDHKDRVVSGWSTSDDRFNIFRNGVVPPGQQVRIEYDEENEDMASKITWQEHLGGNKFETIEIEFEALPLSKRIY